MDFLQKHLRLPDMDFLPKPLQVGGWVLDLANVRGGSVDLFLAVPPY
jgi:hypothetical protein